MATEIATIQSLKAVDAWIDVINANINGGVRTAFKSSRLRFAGSNTEIGRRGNASSLPLQFPEPSLVTANTVIDFTQGAITSSTETTHLAIQGEGFFVLLDPKTAEGIVGFTNDTRILLTRDGEFTTNVEGFLTHVATGYYLVTTRLGGKQFEARYSRKVYNDIDLGPAPTAVGANRMRLSDFLTQKYPPALDARDLPFTDPMHVQTTSIVKVPDKQFLQYSTFGSTVFTFEQEVNLLGGNGRVRYAGIDIANAGADDATLLSKTLEASNASMTQSVPELSLAQKLFSALTKVLQISQTNTDSVLNIVR